MPLPSPQPRRPLRLAARAVRGVGRRLAATPRGGRILRRVARTGAGRRVAGRLGGGAGAPDVPDITVVVPFWGVEKYFRECLNSVVDHGVASMEVLLVDDESPDGSRAIAEEYAAKDPRFRIVDRPNGGLGAARNTGIREARGRYLTFVDSDDALAPGALRSLLSSAERSGSDIVVGAIERYDSTNTWFPAWLEGVHDRVRERTTLADHPVLLRNLYTWNKLFRRDFWDAQGLWFREGVSYEDQPIITQLLHRASAIDVIPDVVYRYRQRDDQSSISQQTASLRDLDFRIQAWEETERVIREEMDQATYEAWQLTLLDAHFQWYLASTGTVDDDYWQRIQAAVRRWGGDAPQWAWDQTLPPRRVLTELALQDRRADVQELVRRRPFKPDDWPARVTPDGIDLELPFHGDPDLDPALFLLRPEQLQVVHAVENVHWVDRDDGEVDCWLSGWAYLLKLDLSEGSGQRAAVSVVLQRADTGEQRVFATSPDVTLTSPLPSLDPWCDYDPGRFGVRVPVSEVLATAPAGTPWYVMLRVEGGGFTVTKHARWLLRMGAAGVVPAAPLGDRGRVVVDWKLRVPMAFRLDPHGLRTEGLALVGRRLSGQLHPTAGRPRVISVEAHAPGVRTESEVRPDGTFALELPAAHGLRTARPVEWRIEGRASDGRRVPLLASRADLPDGAGRPVMASTSRTGELVVDEWRRGAWADRVEVVGDGIRVSGRVFGRSDGRLRLHSRGRGTESDGPEAEVVEGRFTAELDLRHDVYRFGRQPLPIDDHDLSVVLLGDDGNHERPAPLLVSGDLNPALPLPLDTSVHEGRIVRGARGEVRVSIVRPLGEVRGRYHQNQQRLALADPGRRTRGLTRGLLLRSYFGEKATDNGVSIQAELQRRGSDLPVYWAVQDRSVVVPEGGIPVIVNSREWFDLLSSASYYVDNMYQPDYHVKPEGQVLVQTFHGYPFKKMGHAHWQQQQFSQAKIDSYDHRAAEWDYLVSPARYATEHLVRDFAYPGEVLEIGYPRNDVLKSDRADEIRAATRASLGIRDDQTAVLYAPTFRDYMALNDNRAVMADFFDLDTAARALGEGYVLLVRGHAFNARTAVRVGSIPGCVDVTDYPEVSDLYLAADAAVVDYSSLRFDFGVTGKPMVFHVPDLQRYKDTRGWIMDFEPTAPGPLLDTTEEVAATLADLDGVRRDHAAAYETFTKEFLDLDDGHAGRRFVEAVMVPRGDA